jgi:hypothetical protein
MKAACPRLFEVEALRDGRLTGAELVRFQSHLGACPVCKREARALQALAEALRPPTLVGADELHVRRERTRLLAAFDASLVPAARQRSAPLWLRSAVAVATLSLLTALVFVLWPASPLPSSPAPTPPQELPRATSPDPVTVQADGGARWSRRVETRHDEIVLEHGTLSIRVEHGASRRRLLVILPDGELEDIGTTFSVSADAGRTQRVSVRDGLVVLRLHGKPPLSLAAGESWNPPPAPVAAVPAALPPAPAPRRVKPTPSTARGPSRSTPVADPSADFRAAMSAFDSGDNASAAARFGAYVSQHASDPRAEDAAYLRIIALQRAGDSRATQQAARDYLTRYPAGFRRAEAESLSR